MNPEDARQLGHLARVRARHDAIAALPPHLRELISQMDAARHRYERLRRHLRREFKRRGLPPLPRIGGES